MIFEQIGVFTSGFSVIYPLLITHRLRLVRQHLKILRNLKHIRIKWIVNFLYFKNSESYGIVNFLNI